jgi:Uma2 family endonuclease
MAVAPIRTETESLKDPPKKRRVIYPESDGKPMAEDELHRTEMTNSIGSLQVWYRDRNDVRVAGNDFVYWEEGNPKARISPDCYVVFGVEKKVRRNFKAWEEGGRLPSVIFEFTSKKTRHEDVKKKLPLYEQVLKVAEYFQFDPTGDYLKPRLQGFRLREGVYEPIPLLGDRMVSEQLGLELVMQGERLRFRDPVKGEWLLTLIESEQARAAEAEAREFAERRAEAEAQARAEAEAELKRLRAELEALRGERSA